MTLTFYGGRPRLEQARKKVEMELRGGPFPINTLPPELFLRVLEEGLRPFVEFETIIKEAHLISDYYERLRELMEVCSRWRNVILNRPLFWRYASIREHGGLLELHMARSAGLSLDVECSIAEIDFDPTTMPVRPHHLYTFHNVVGSQYHRWRTAFVSFFRPEVPKFQGLLETPSPRLESAFIWCVNTPPAPFNLFGGSAARLRNLDLVGIPIPWDSLVLRGLHHLRLSDIQAYQPSLSDILQILNNCIDLAYLQIWKIDISVDSESSSTVPSGFIKLPRLKTLILSHISQFAIHGIVNSIENFSSCTELVVACSFTGASLTDYLEEALLRLKPCIRRLARLNNPAENPRCNIGFLFNTNNDFCLKAEDGSLEITMYNDPADGEYHQVEGVIWLNTVVDPRTPAFVNCTWDSRLSPLEAGELMAALQSFAVTDLKVHGTECTSAWFEYLGHPAKDNSPGWPFPELVYAGFEQSLSRTPVTEYQQELLEMLKARYGNRPPLPLPPKRLEYLGIQGFAEMEPIILKEIDTILGEGVREHTGDSRVRMSTYLGPASSYSEPDSGSGAEDDDDDEEDYYEEEDNYDEGSGEEEEADWETDSEAEVSETLELGAVDSFA